MAYNNGKAGVGAVYAVPSARSNDDIEPASMPITRPLSINAHAVPSVIAPENSPSASSCNPL